MGSEVTSTQTSLGFNDSMGPGVTKLNSALERTEAFMEFLGSWPGGTKASRSTSSRSHGQCKHCPYTNAESPLPSHGKHGPGAAPGAARSHWTLKPGPSIPDPQGILPTAPLVPVQVQTLNVLVDTELLAQRICVSSCLRCKMLTKSQDLHQQNSFKSIITSI